MVIIQTRLFNGTFVSEEEIEKTAKEDTQDDQKAGLRNLGARGESEVERDRLFCCSMNSSASSTTLSMSQFSISFTIFLIFCSSSSDFSLPLRLDNEAKIKRELSTKGSIDSFNSYSSFHYVHPHLLLQSVT